MFSNVKDIQVRINLFVIEIKVLNNILFHFCNEFTFGKGIMEFYETRKSQCLRFKNNQIKHFLNNLI